MTGPADGMSSSPFRCPSWNTQTVMPSAAATDSRNPSTALSGTSSERNATASRASASTTIRPTNSGSASASLPDTSIAAAVAPATYSVPPFAMTAALCSRSRSTSSLVSRSSGPVRGTTGTATVLPSALATGRPTAATPGSAESVACSSARAGSRRSAGIPAASTTATRVALKPGPKPSLSRS